MKVSIRGLTKVFPRGARALDGIDLEIGQGMFGLLGPNGAGKTTLMSILATLMRPTSGEVRVDGWNVTNPQHRFLIKSVLGYLPQELGLYPDLNAHEFLSYMATLKGVEAPSARRREVERLLDAVGLEAAARKKVKSLSGGMKRRLGIAQALIGEPKLLIVDEPTAGLDPAERVRFRTLLADLSGERVVILSTHIVEDVVATCSRVAVLSAGTVAFDGTPSELARQADGRVWQAALHAGERAPRSWRVVARVAAADVSTVRVIGPRPTADAVPVKPSMEDGYLQLIGGSGEVRGDSAHLSGT